MSSQFRKIFSAPRIYRIYAYPSGTIVLRLRQLLNPSSISKMYISMQVTVSIAFWTFGINSLFLG